MEEQFREDIDDVWSNQIWPRASEIANVIGSTLQAPRRVLNQTMRSNVPGDDRDYFKISIGIKLLDFITSDLRTRFGKEQLMIARLLSLKPVVLKDKTPEVAWSDLE